MLSSKCVLTDSGGIQAETSFLGVSCLTLRDTTERPFTVSQGTNRLIGTDPARIPSSLRDAVMRTRPSRHIIAGFDGKAAERIVAAIAGFEQRRKELIG